MFRQTDTSEQTEVARVGPGAGSAQIDVLKRGAGTLRRLGFRWEALLIVLILVVGLVNSRLSPFFLNGTNLLRTTSDFMEIGIMVLPMVFIIITGNIDLSIASTLGLAASLMGWL
jgi:rhamnose transport system permease protein